MGFDPRLSVYQVHFICNIRPLKPPDLNLWHCDALDTNPMCLHIQHCFRPNLAITNATEILNSITQMDFQRKEANIVQGYILKNPRIERTNLGFTFPNGEMAGFYRGINGQRKLIFDTKWRQLPIVTYQRHPRCLAMSYPCNVSRWELLWIKRERVNRFYFCSKCQV